MALLSLCMRDASAMKLGLLRSTQVFLSTLETTACLSAFLSRHPDINQLAHSSRATLILCWLAETCKQHQICCTSTDPLGLHSALSIAKLCRQAVTLIRTW